MAKVSSIVCGLAGSAPSVHRSTATSRRVGVGCGCHYGLVKAWTQARHLTLAEPQMTGDVDSSEVLEQVAASLRTCRGGSVTSGAL